MIDLATLSVAWTVIASQNTAAPVLTWMWRLDSDDRRLLDTKLKAGEIITAQRRVGNGVA